ncbi:hypothetical protein WMF31_33385 [Sorangium sp. So ce1036]|uniref:hypothetical protein n=1 Tax=Sorangium sp. So ce1036 TaxID=3133328 RepID=UPI003F07BA68
MADRGEGEHLAIAPPQPGGREPHGEEPLARRHELLVLPRRLRPRAPRIGDGDLPAHPGGQEHGHVEAL